MEKPKVFTREATGLVREISALGSFGVAVTGVGVISIFLFYRYFMVSTGDNPLLSILLMAVPFLACRNVGIARYDLPAERWRLRFQLAGATPHNSSYG